MWSQVLSGPASKKTTPPQRSVRAMAAKAVLLQLLQSVFQVVEICRARILRFLSKSFHIFWSHSPWSNSYNSPNESKQCAGAGGIGRIHWIHWGSTFRLKDRENERKKERKKGRKKERKRERWQNGQTNIIQCCNVLHVLNVKYLLCTKVIKVRDALCDIFGGSMMKRASLALSATRCWQRLMKASLESSENQSADKQWQV